MVVETYLGLLQAYGQLLLSLDYGVIVVLLVLLGLFLLSVTVLRLLARKLGVPLGAVAALRWLFLLLMLYAVQHFVISRIDSNLLATPLIIAKTLSWWFFIKNMLDGVYTDILVRRIQKRDINHYLMDLCKLVVVVILFAGAITSIYNIDVSAVLTSSAILTAIIGLSMQDTIGSVISGLLLQIERPFAPGDWVEVGTEKGRVAEINWRYTRIITQVNNTVFIPNNAISKEKLINYSRPVAPVFTKLVIKAPIEVPPVRVKAALENTLKNATLVSDYPPCSVRILDVAANGIEYALFFYVRRLEDQFAARDQLYSSIWYQFLKMGIEPPYPAQEVRLSRKSKMLQAEEITPQLEAVPLFSGLSASDLTLLVRSAAICEFEAKDAIVNKGDTHNSMYVVLNGEVHVLKNNTEIARLAPGDVFGEMALLTGKTRNADIIAATPAQCLEIDREAFRIILADNKQLLKNIKDIFNQRAQQHADDTRTQQTHHAESLLRKFKRIFM